MAQEKDKLINLAIHESSDPSVIDPNYHKEASGAHDDLKDANHDDQNVDVPHSDPFDASEDENPLVSSPITAANLGAG